MKITLKLYASLGQYMPAHAIRNEAEIEVEDGSGLLAVLDARGVPPEHCHLVLLNGHYIAPSQREGETISEGDALAVWPPVAGG